MSRDIFLQTFDAGDVDRTEAVFEILAPLMDDAMENVVLADGGAAVYGIQRGKPVTSLMFNYVDGNEIWNVIYRVAAATSWAVVPVDGPVCVTSEEQITSLPRELVQIVGYRVIKGGPDLMQAIIAVR